MKFAIIICCILFPMIAFSQSFDFDKKYDELLGYLQAENWTASETSCKDLLRYAEASDSMQTEKRVLRCIYIYSTAGLLNEKKLSKSEALAKVKYLKGKEMIMPAHPFNSNCYTNCTQISDKDKDIFFSGVTNSNATQIFSFEYVKIKKGIKESKNELEGKFIVLKGTLNEISVEGEMLPRFKLRFIDGDYQIQNE